MNQINKKTLDILHQLEESIDISTAMGTAINAIKEVLEDIENIELHEAEDLVWDGTLLTLASDDIAVTGKSAVLLYIDNQSDQGLTVTFYHKIGDDYAQYFGGDGEALSFPVTALSSGVFGPIQAWPKYDGGRVVLTAETAPTDQGVTTIQVQEV